MLKNAVIDLKISRLVLFPAIAWLLRTLSILPFVNEKGNLIVTFSENPGGAGLPANVDYFFSTLFFVVIFLTLFFSKLLFSKSGTGNYFYKGLVISASFILVFLGIDIILELIILKRAIHHYFVAIFLDYSPVVLIPVIVGSILQQEYLKFKR